MNPAKWLRDKAHSYECDANILEQSQDPDEKHDAEINRMLAEKLRECAKEYQEEVLGDAHRD